MGVASEPPNDAVPSAGARSSPERTARGVAPQAAALRAEVVRLVREKKYEEALAQLYAARAEDPDNKELRASIQQIKEFLVGSYAKRLGGLDRIAGPLPHGAPRFPDALLVARYIDGSSTFDDIRRSCPLGQLRTLQVLVALYSGSPESVPALESETPPPPVLRALPGGSVARPAQGPPAPHAEEIPETKRARGSSIPVDPPSDVLSSPRDSQIYEIGRSSAPVASIPSDPPATYAPPRPPESPEDARFREAFARGTQAFVQRRYDDAIEAFRECERLRPLDNAATTMLRRAMKDAQRT